MRKSFLVVVVAAAALATPALASAARADGVVVQVDAKPRQIALAQAQGRVALVHLQSLARVAVGRHVQLNLRALRNGTFAGSALRVLGVARTTHVRGYVVAVRRARGSFTLAAHGAVLTIYPKRAMRKVAAVGGGTPPVGSVVDATVSADTSGQLQATQVSQITPSASASASAIGGTLSAMGDGKLTVTNDGATITLTVAPGFDLSKFKVGDSVLAFFSKQADGSLGLTALTGNGSAAEADDQQESVGDVSGAQNQVDDGEQSQCQQGQAQQDQSQLQQQEQHQDESQQADSSSQQAVDQSQQDASQESDDEGSCGNGNDD